MIQQPKIWFIGPVNENYSDKVEYCSIEQCYGYLKDQMEIGVDIETTRKFPKGKYSETVYEGGLDPYLSLTIMLQLGTKDNVYVIDTRSVDITPLLPLWENKERLWLGHNLKFEAKHLLHNYGIIFYKIYDTMLVEQIQTNGLQLGYSLEKLAGRHLGIKPIEKQGDLFKQKSEDDDEEEQAYIDKSIRMGFLTIGDRPFTEAQILYGADDILYPIEIRKRQRLGYMGYNPKQVVDIENEFCLVLADIELKGITFDKQQWLDTYDKNLIIFNSRKKKLDDWVVQNFKDNRKFCSSPDLFDPNPKCLIEWSSSKQVVALMKELGYCPQEKSKSTKYLEYTVGAKALLKLLPAKYKEFYSEGKETDIVDPKKDLILNYLLFKTSEQACTTFGKDFLKYVHPITGRLHSSYRQILNTGRVSSRNPNLQNIDSHESYRKAFCAPAGYKLINADYSAQELRDLAEVTQDPDMLDFFNNGHPVFKDDFHSWTATKMFSLMRNEPDLVVTKKTHPEERNAAKAINFKINYGGGAHTLKDDFGVDDETAQKFIDNYMDAFPTLKKNFEITKEKAVKTGYIDIIPDRRYWDSDWNRMQEVRKQCTKYYPKDYKDFSEEKKQEFRKKLTEESPELKGMWSEYYTLRGSLERSALNYRIQGLAAIQMKEAAIRFRRQCIEENTADKMYITSLIHDEMIAEALEGYTDQCQKQVQKSMEEGGNRFCKSIKMTAEAVIVDWWHH
jgi:DNA polymerase I-like protein with 3'-5' exonuclease and polymerase domains